ncbi:DoxX family protein [Botrimarina hoheduenensis]|uniref:Putative oxidoreductase CatD n=1 Tax=Botrimarina hoheduenensis TaxID=2528000 RepID=A0A5C5WE97_9BACT|nr:DoxX family protein [Botrimarina hoheduenensis]TWT48473.1 putative oxidoreductase CatD [Botrimarina hoheduenensis]
MITECCRSADAGKLLLRLTVGGLMLFHGADKLHHGAGGIEGLLASQGLPAAMAYGVYVGEVIAPALLVVGFLTRSAGAIMAFNMLVAVLLAHRGDLLSVTEHGGWALELQALYLFGAAAIALLGPGRWSIDAVLAKPRDSVASEG